MSLGSLWHGAEDAEWEKYVSDRPTRPVLEFCPHCGEMCPCTSGCTPEEIERSRVLKIALEKAYDLVDYDKVTEVKAAQAEIQKARIAAFFNK